MKVQWQVRSNGQNDKANKLIYSALIEKIGDDIEEEVSVLICEEKVTCFASYMPYPVHVGEVYQVELVAVVFNEYFIEESDELPSIFRTGTDYSYLLTGILGDGNINCGSIIFFDDLLSEDFGFLRGKMVSWKVDRLDICFLE
ncbi:hypothetical protein [Rhizobium laguerreae]|nr:hypothetical protein [Rhizobium laguerreae]